MEIITQFLQEASISVISIAALVYIVTLFIKNLDERTVRHEKAMLEREAALRKVESEIRATMSEHIKQSSIAISENTKILERVIKHFEKI